MVKIYTSGGTGHSFGNPGRQADRHRLERSERGASVSPGRSREPWSHHRLEFLRRGGRPSGARGRPIHHPWARLPSHLIGRQRSALTNFAQADINQLCPSISSSSTC